MIKDTYSYRGWLVSDSLYKRLLAFLGYLVIVEIFAILIILIILALVGITANY